MRSYSAIHQRRIGSWATRLLPLLLACSGCSAGERSDIAETSTTALTTVDVDDFLVQDVCDRNGVATSDDPVACPAGTARRNMYLGERITYYRIDQLDDQAATSFAFLGPTGRKIWIETYDWGPTTIYADPKGNPMYNSDGTIARQAFMETTDPASRPGQYDIMDSAVTNPAVAGTTPNWVAWSGTDVYQWVDDCATRGVTGGWLLFPLTATPGGHGTLDNQLTPVGDTAPCPTSRSASRTKWSWNKMYYTNGKYLDTIWVDHSCNVDSNPANDCFERHFFTREYGMTRWERWQSRQDPANPPPATPNPMNCNGTWETATMWRKYCRDFSNVRALPNGATWNPRSYPLAQQVGKGNLVRNADFAYRNGAFWTLYSPPNMPSSWSVREDAGTHNHRLYLSCSSCSGNSVYQDVARGSMATGSNIWWGADVTAETGGTATLYLFQIDASGRVVSSDHTTVSVGPGNVARQMRHVTVNANTAMFRIQLYMGSPSVSFILDDAFLTNW